MSRLPLAFVTPLAVALSACTGSDARLPQGVAPHFVSLETVASGRRADAPKRIATPVAVLPAWIGRPTKLREHAEAETFEQTVSLDLTPRGETRENVLRVAVFPPDGKRSTLGNFTTSDMGRPTEAGIRAEIAAAFPGLSMQVVTRPAANAYGPYGLAVGRRANGVRCLYAWQWIAEAPAITGDRAAPVSLRVRLCRNDISLDAMAASVDRIRLVPRFAGEVVATSGPAAHPARRRSAARTAAANDEAGSRDRMIPRQAFAPALAEVAPERTGPRYLGEETGSVASARMSGASGPEAASLRRMPTPGSGTTIAQPTALAADLPPEAYRGPGPARP